MAGIFRPVVANVDTSQVLPRSIPGKLGVLVLIFIFAARPARAQTSADQAFIDAATLGVGLNFYQGDLDQNPNNNFIKFFGLANLNLLAKAERRWGDFGGGVMVTYDRFTGKGQSVDFANNGVGLSLTGSYDLPLFRPNLLRAFVGVGPMLLIPKYYHFGESVKYNNDDKGTRFIGALMVGVIIQNRVHVAVRATSSDFIDGSGGQGNSSDFLSFINLGYRFTFP